MMTWKQRGLAREAINDHAAEYLQRGSWPPGTMKRFCQARGIRRADLILALDRQRELVREPMSFRRKDR